MLPCNQQGIRKIASESAFRPLLQSAGEVRHARQLLTEGIQELDRNRQTKANKRHYRTHQQQILQEK